MAVLDLMLSNHPAPWNRGEFHPLREDYPWIGEKKLLRLPMHMLDAVSLEDALTDHFWVFAAVTTNVGYTLKVTDTVSGVVKEYVNPVGRAAPAITDTAAFAGCQEP